MIVGHLPASYVTINLSRRRRHPGHDAQSFIQSFKGIILFSVAIGLLYALNWFVIYPNFN